MANIQHSAIADPDIHEPKGASSASEGEVYTADGLGSGVWEQPSGATFGEAEIVANTTNQTLIAAADPTLETHSDFVKTTGSLWTIGETNLIDFNADGYLEIPTTGTYEVSLWVSYFFSVNTTLVAFRFSTDDTVNNLNVRKVARMLGTGLDVGVGACSWYKPLTAGDKVSIWVASDKSGDLTIVDSGLNIALLKEA